MSDPLLLPPFRVGEGGVARGFGPADAQATPPPDPLPDEERGGQTPSRGPVVKVGGSLFADPGLRLKLRALLAGLPGRALFVAGGGAIADAVRDRVHRLGEAAAHLVALESLHASAAFLRHLVPDADVLNAPEFLREFAITHGPVPAAWSLTTDSIAALAAAHFGRDLLLLKSVTIPPGTSWPAAAARGWVDGEFARVVARHGVRVTALNLRGDA